MTAKLLVIAVVCVTLALAGDPVATVSTSGSLTLNGTQVPNAGVSEWPVAAGDEIVTTTAPAVILFRDGTRIAVDRNTRARLNKTGRTGVDVITGAVSYKAASASDVSMFALGRPVDLQSRAAGLVSVQGAKVVARGLEPNEGLGLALGHNKKPKPPKPDPRSGHKKDDGDNDKGNGRGGKSSK